MAQIFSRRSNAVARACLVILLTWAALVGWLVHAVIWSPYVTRVGVPLEQPVPFSHAHHVGDMGIDCRYCHTSVEKSAFAGMPSTQTCMTCHSQVWAHAPVLESVRRSFEQGTPLRWNRVYDLPDFVSFDHSIHVHKGIGCSSCHGDVGQMPLTWKVESLYMKWCLECHRDPSKWLRDRNDVFNAGWKPGRRSANRSSALVEAYGIKTAQLVDCGICHR